MQIKKPLFWDKKNLLSFLLYPFTSITLIINLFKNFSNKKNINIKTICVGNIYLGGTGKTPLVLAIKKIINKKYKTVFIKKDYTDQFDEKKLLESEGKLITKKDRENCLKTAKKKGFDVAILDDGLQEKGINYNISIACFNSTSGIGNGYLLPAGPLRENLSNLKNYDAIFLNGEKKNRKLLKIFKKINKKLKIFEAEYVPINIKKFNRKKKFLVFSGIGNPDEFTRTLKKYKFKIVKKIIFPDHFDFSNDQINKIKYTAKKEKLEIITTEKDYNRLSYKNKRNIKFLKIFLNIKNKKMFAKFLEERL